MPVFPKEVSYSQKYYDDNYEYRHVILTEEMYNKLPKGKLLTDLEWRQLGVQQSMGWEHYMIFNPEPWVMLFRRPLGVDPRTGQIMWK